MSKLRINPRKNDNLENREKKQEITSHAFPPVMPSNHEDIHFFLNMNVHDFTEETLKKFQIACQQYNRSFIENTEKINAKLFLLATIVPSLKHTKTIEKTSTNKDSLVVNLPVLFLELQSLIQEIIDDETNESINFVKDLIERLIEIDKRLQHNEPMLENVYNQLTELLVKLQSYSISQQKYIYRSIASCVNKKYPEFHLISPEDGSFADPKFHRIVQGNGQRIVRGLSFILIDKNSDEVLKFGNIKTI
jgi:hypothetical protein